MNCRGGHRHGSASDRRTPRPWTCFGVAAGLLARRSRSPPVFPTRCGVSDVDREQLTAYSCGGSAGFSRGSRDSPASLLATKSCDVVDRDGYIWCYSLRPVNARSDAVAKFRVELCKACEKSSCRRGGPQCPAFGLASENLRPTRMCAPSASTHSSCNSPSATEKICPGP
jgi:hypothetical protein